MSSPDQMVVRCRHRGVDSRYHRKMLAWMDLEMTGLDSEKNRIVEIATLVTDDDLKVIAEGPDLVISQTEAVLAEMDEVVLEMHTRSGLLELIKASTVKHDEAAAETLAFLKQHIPGPRTVPLCGNSIGTDRRFLARWMPEIEDYLHYRSVDVTSIKELGKRWHAGRMSGAPRKKTSHRALDDIKESIEELRFYRGALFREPDEVAAETPVAT